MGAPRCAPPSRTRTISKKQPLNSRARGAQPAHARRPVPARDPEALTEKFPVATYPCQNRLPAPSEVLHWTQAFSKPVLLWRKANCHRIHRVGEDLHQGIHCLRDHHRFFDDREHEALSARDLHAEH